MQPYKAKQLPRKQKKKPSFQLSQRRQLQPRSYPIPRSYEYTGRYVDFSFLLDPGIGSPAWQVFNLSSLFDPDTTGTGHQPIGFDQLIPMYDHYTVHHAEVRLIFTSTDVTYPQMAVIALEDEATTSTQFATVVENGRCSYDVVGPRGGSQQVVELTMDIDHSLFFGRNVLSGDKYMGTATTSPLEACFLHVGVSGVAALNTGGCFVSAEIIYHARLSEPTRVVGS